MAAPTSVLVLLLLVALAHARLPKIYFKRVQSNYPKRVFEAQGTLMSVNGVQHLVVIGGFYNFPGVTMDVYRRRLTARWAPWHRLASMP